MRRVGYWLPLLYVPAFLGWYFALEARPPGGEIVVASPLDAWIPFNEWFILAYGAWFPYLLGFIAWLYIADRKQRVEVPRLAFLLIIGLTACLVGYTLWSTTTGDLRPDPYPRANWATDIVRALQEFDTPTNVFPSMHVYSSIVVAHCIWISRYLRDRPWVKWVSAGLCVVISASTAVLKQHSIVDAFGAVALFGLVWGAAALVPRLRAVRSAPSEPIPALEAEASLPR